MEIGKAVEIGEAMDTTASSKDRTAFQVLENSRKEVEEIVSKMVQIKKENKPKSQLRELITQASLNFLTLRQTNRAILLNEDRVKAETESAKAPVDFTTLQLHNLMYEKNHYLKAIKACKDFRSKYPDIDLVPEDEFFANAPEDIKKNSLSSDEAHDFMLKRLNYELLQRKELCKLNDKLEHDKKCLLDNIATRKKFLSSLPSHLKLLKKASLPVQQYLEVPHSKKVKQRRAAELLPPPLYILYSQLLAQKEAFGERIEIEIIGSMKEAQAFALQIPNKDNGVSANVDINTLDDDNIPDDEDDGQRRRKRPKKVAGKDDLDQSEIYKPHPLIVVLDVFDDDANCDAVPPKLLTLNFEYLVKLNVVCVGVVESGINILSNLFPDDTGTELPHLTAKVFAGEGKLFDESRNSRPFKWAQHLAGMDFLPDMSPLLKSESPRDAHVLSGLALYHRQKRVVTLLQRIRSRKKAQMALQVQLDSLQNLRWPSLSYENVPWASHLPVCVLQHFSPTSYNSSPSLNPLYTEKSMASTEDGRLRMSREESEGAREDGELPSSLYTPIFTDDLNRTPSKLSIDIERSTNLALISKSVTPSSKGKSQSSRKKYDDDLDILMLDNESDIESSYLDDTEKEDVDTAFYKDVESWIDFDVQEYHLILSRVEKDMSLKLQARIKISMEFPTRPPLFSLSFSNDTSNTVSMGVRWYNELRAMESEVNLHILKHLLSSEQETGILAHQVRCLAMLFDFQFNELQTRSQTMMKSSSVIDVGLCKPVTGNITSRSVRGRDRRKIASWKNMDCTQGYPI